MEADEAASLRRRIEGLAPSQREALGRRLHAGGEPDSGRRAAGTAELVAYVVPGAGAFPVEGALRDFLKSKLPEYMLPSAFVVLDALPRTPNGKLDVRALPAPDRARAGGRKRFVAPRTPVEERVAAIWREVLGVERVGIDDNFADLGGHSLLAIRVMTRLRSAFEVALPMRSLFETSTLAALAALIETVSGSVSRPELPPLTLAPRDAPLPLSLAQRGLWFLDQMEPGNPFYNVYSPVRLTGPLDVDVLERSLTEVIRRHEILRTTFPTVEGHPVQVVAPPADMPLTVVDLRARAVAARETELLRLAREDMRRPFDLAAGPLVRATLVRLGPDDHALFVTLHHIVADLWSAGLLLREVGVIYAAFAAGRPSPLSALPVQYADFASWQQGWSRGEYIERQLDYWKKHLEGAPPILGLPTDRPRPPVQSFRGDRVSFKLPAPLVASLSERGREQGATLFVTLLAAFKTLLYRYSGETDICVASPVANRSLPELEGLIGYFLNTVVLRTDLSGDPGFDELVARVRDVVFEAMEYRDIPAERVLEALHIERSLSHNPLTQVGFALQNAPIGALELPGLTLNLLDVHSGTTKGDLDLLLWDAPGGLAGMVEYSTDLFDAATIERMVAAFVHLLENVVADPAQPISRVPLIGSAEPRRASAEPSASRTALGVHELFETQASRAPEAIAVVSGDEEISYRELDRRSNQLARHLARLGVGPDQLVGICMDKSPEMIVAVIGVLKAGGAYIPLDPAHPAERLAGMLADARVPLLLTQGRLLSSLDAADTRVLAVDAEWERIAQESGEPLGLPTPAKRRVYAIFTSGSTGRPKLAAVHHGGFSNLLQWFVGEFGISRDDGTLLVSSFNFDLTQKNLFAPLVTGGRLYLPEVEGYDPAAIRDTVGRHRITLLNCTPSAFYPLVDEIDDEELGKLGSLRHVFLGGEPIAMRRLTPWTRSGHCRAEIVNTYGPTECTDVCAFYRVEDPEGFQEAAVPIGRAIPNTRLYVLDSALGMLPMGAVGELCVAGAGVGEGYLNDAGLTAQSFVPDPLAAEPGARLYRTGDLVRHRHDGALEFLGRIDHQVKVRGFRIELGEIEEVLGTHPGVRDVVVLARDDAKRDKYLAAYVVSAPDHAAGVSDLRRHALARLPEYMVPASFVFLDALPLTPNGKVDRRALPEPDRTQVVAAAPFVPPRTAPEAALAAIVAEVLGVEQVGIHENFFELGGDSILAIQAIAKANRAGLRLTPRQLFQHQTIAELAEVVGTAPVITAEQGAVVGPVPLTPIQRYFLEECTVDPHHFNQAVLLEVARPLDPAHLRSTVEVLLAHHDALRSRFELTESGWTQRMASPAESPAGTVFAEIDLGGLAEDEQTRRLEAAAAEVQGSLDLAAGPLMRVAHFRLGAGRADRLLLVIHHLAVDTVSWRILLEDFQMAYEQVSRGRVAVLPPKTTSFRTWARRLTEYARPEMLHEEAPYWLAAGEASAAPLPVDHPGGVNTVASTRTVTMALDARDTKFVLQELPPIYHTQINEVLLSALVGAFAEWTGQESLRVALEGHGREGLFEDVDVSRTVGWFTTIYPVTLERARALAPDAALGSVKEQLRRIPRHGFGYGLLRHLADDARIQSALAGAPRPQVTFNYLGQLDQALPADLSAALARESSGPSQSGRAARAQLFDVMCSVIGGELCVSFTYSENLHDRTTVESLAGAFIRQLQAIAAHGRSARANGYRPADFPDAALGQEELDNLLEELRESDS